MRRAGSNRDPPVFLCPQRAAPASLEQVQAIAAQRCLACHSGEAAQKGVRLDSAEGLAARVQAAAKGTKEQVVLAHRLALGRSPSAEETLLGEAYLAGKDEEDTEAKAS